MQAKQPHPGSVPRDVLILPEREYSGVLYMSRAGNSWKKNGFRIPFYFMQLRKFILLSRLSAPHSR
jgi:hypothetical protein